MQYIGKNEENNPKDILSKTEGCPYKERVQTMKSTDNNDSGNWNSLSSYLREISAEPQLSEDELRTTTALAAGGDVAAQERLVRSHLRLVVTLARQYAGYGLPVADLVSEGNIGLIRAAQLYDPKFGTKFSTYAAVWIKQRIHRCITMQARSVRIPVWRSQRLRKVARLNDELSATLGRAPTDGELATRLGVSEEELSEAQGDRLQVSSLDAAIDPHDSDPLEAIHRMADENTPDAISALTQQELHDELVAALHDLDDRELEVVGSKFGLGNQQTRSFREIGRMLGKSHEWIRRIAELAIVKLRRAMESVSSLPGRERQRRRGVVKARLQKLGWQTAAVS